MYIGNIRKAPHLLDGILSCLTNGAVEFIAENFLLSGGLLGTFPALHHPMENQAEAQGEQHAEHVLKDAQTHGGGHTI